MKLSVTIATDADLRRRAAALVERLRQDIERDLQAGMTAAQDDTTRREILAQVIRRRSRS